MSASERLYTYPFPLPNNSHTTLIKLSNSCPKIPASYHLFLSKQILPANFSLLSNPAPKSSHLGLFFRQPTCLEWALGYNPVRLVCLLVVPDQNNYACLPWTSQIWQSIQQLIRIICFCVFKVTQKWPCKWEKTSWWKCTWSVNTYWTRTNKKHWKLTKQSK